MHHKGFRYNMLCIFLFMFGRTVCKGGSVMTLQGTRNALDHCEVLATATDVGRLSEFSFFSSYCYRFLPYTTWPAINIKTLLAPEAI